jgi:putative heme-binding domain-containing protein
MEQEKHLMRKRVAIQVASSLVVFASLLLAQNQIGNHQLHNSALPAMAVGDPMRGLLLFESTGNCLSCHRVKDKGTRLGLDLTEIGTLRDRDELTKAMVAPSAEVQPQNRMYRVVMRDGTAVTGKLLNQDPFSLQMLDSNERLRSFPTSSLRDYGFVATPPMPSYKDKFSPEEMSDLLAYLSSLKGVVAQ